MEDVRLGVVEARFADIIWENEPIQSRALSKICERELNWKRPTTYNVLRKLCEKGLFQNNDGMVSAVISKQEFYAMQSERFVEETFEGSLPAFLNAFATRKSLSREEIDQIRKMIDAYEEG